MIKHNPYKLGLKCDKNVWSEDEFNWKKRFGTQLIYSLH